MAEENFSFVPQKQTRHCSKRSPHPPADCPQQSRARAKSTSPDARQAGTAAHSHGSAPVARKTITAAIPLAAATPIIRRAQGALTAHLLVRPRDVNTKEINES